MKMKRINSILFIGLLLGSVAFTGCKKFLDINDNPNTATDAGPDLILPQAIVRTAARMVSFNDWGAGWVGYQANAGGVSGWGAFVTYNFTTSDFAGLFDDTYKALEDLQQVIDGAGDDETMIDMVAAAKILQVWNYQNLVDTYNDVPYSEALTGADAIQPKYDKAEDIYVSLAEELDEAMSTLDNDQASLQVFKNADKLFNGNKEKWIQFANTLKLRLMVRGQGKVQFSNTSFNSAGFLKDDALVNPGYVQDNGKQNPTWNTWAYDYTGTAPTRASQRIPTPFVLSFYNGDKILDSTRMKLTFKINSGKIANNQLGYQEDDAAKGFKPSGWFVGNDDKDYAHIGILKGPRAGQPIMLLAESYFLQAQANLAGILGAKGDAKVNFEKGIAASFAYLEKGENDKVDQSIYDPEQDAADYIADNSGNPLVDFDAATTDAAKLEAIVTQEYIAYNMILGHQTWYEFNRTGYPKISGSNSTGNAKNTFVSIQSESSGLDKLPSRLAYPANEFTYNASNVPRDINVFTSKIFFSR